MTICMTNEWPGHVEVLPGVHGPADGGAGGGPPAQAAARILHPQAPAPPLDHLQQWIIPPT